MADFGNAVSDFQNVGQSSTGYIVAIDLSSGRIRKIKQVQLHDEALTFGDPVVDETSLDQLYAYLKSSSAPPVAMKQTSTTLYVFLRSDLYPSNQANRIGLFYESNAGLLDDPTDVLRVPTEARNLLKSIVLRTMKYNQEKRVELDVSQAVVREKRKLKLQ